MLLYFSDSKKIGQVYWDLVAKGKHLDVFRRDDVPAKYYYSKNKRCGDLVVVAKSPYSVAVREKNRRLEAGVHGYDPDASLNMRGVFYSMGPNIKEAKVVESFRNIHIYPFILKLLGLKVLAPIDGSEDVLAPLYDSKKHHMIFPE